MKAFSIDLTNDIKEERVDIIIECFMVQKQFG